MSMSDEKRREMSERMKARHAAKREAVDNLAEPSEAADATVDEVRQGVSKADYDALLQRFSELESRLGAPRSEAPYQPFNPGPQVNQRGALVGTFEKYAVDPAHYPDPTSRLADEAKLLRVPFKKRATAAGGYYEYDLEFAVTPVTYQTKDGINTVEPRFTLKLNRFLPDEDGNPTNRAYTACQLVFHEDPQAALVIARDNGFPVEEQNEEHFLNEMRYLRMRDWLLEAFYPVKTREVHDKKQMVVGNRLVEVFEVTSQNPAKLDFSDLKQKL